MSHRHPGLDTLLGALTAGSSIVLSPTCGTSAGLAEALAVHAERLAGSRVRSGLLFDGYDFLDTPEPWLRYETWHVGGAIRDRVANGEVGYFPLRASAVDGLLRGNGGTDMVVAQTSLPDAAGYCSLGLSASYVLAAAEMSRGLLLHMNPAIPNVPGPARVKASDATLTVTHEQDPVEFPSAPHDEVARAIVSHVEPLVPDGATVQVGFGTVPDALIEVLSEAGRRDLTVWGMATDGVVRLADAGVLRTSGGPSVVTHDAVGTRALFDWLDENPSARLVDYSTTVSVPTIARIRTFVSVNSAIEVDLTGNVNIESVGGRQVGGVGGGPDFVEGARHSPGGVSVIALPSTARSGTLSRVVATLGGAPHSLPRSAVQYVATEHGIVNLSNLDLRDRAEALIGIADPAFRDGLWATHEDGHEPSRP